MSPKISVIMSVYNSEKYLDESINSILNQSFKDFEFLIVNDCSTDNSLKIIKKYQKKDNRIKLIDNKKNINLANSLNKCLKIVRGKYIARMDADDISFPNRLEIQFEYLEKNPEIFLIGGSAVVINKYGEKIGSLFKDAGHLKIKNKLLKSNPFIHPSIFFRNTKKFFYRGEFKRSQDYDLYLRILESGKKMSNLPNFLIKYRIDEISPLNMQKQLYYFNNAKKFYFQRKEEGQDRYPSFEGNLPLIELKDLNKMRFNTNILIKFQDNQMKEVRKEIKNYFNKYGFNKRFVLYYILSFLPFKVIKLLMKIF